MGHWQRYFPDDWDVLKGYAADQKWEGIVFKDGAFNNWSKWKFKNTIDLIVDKLERGTPGLKHGQGIGNMQLVTTEGHNVASVSNMKEQIRSRLSDDDIGRVCEVEYQEVSTRGRLRHPVFLRWRNDKAGEECGLDQDENLKLHWSKK